MNKSTTQEDYYECNICKINSLGDRRCPCPRGSCEATIVGILKTTKEIVKNSTKNV